MKGEGNEYFLLGLYKMPCVDNPWLTAVGKGLGVVVEVGKVVVLVVVLSLSRIFCNSLLKS